MPEQLPGVSSVRFKIVKSTPKSSPETRRCFWNWPKLGQNWVRHEIDLVIGDAYEVRYYVA